MSNLEKYNEVFCRVMQVCEDEIADLKFKQSKYWDSIGHMTLIAALEEAFDIMLETEDMMAINSYSKGKDILSENYGISF